MKSLPLPTFGVAEILDQVGTGPRVNRVLAARTPIVEGEAEYIARGPLGTIWDVRREHAEIDVDLESDIRYVYKAKLAAPKGNVRAFYNKLRGAAPRGRCPFCLQREVSALDHHLPQDRWGRLATVPANLVPICGACNYVKREDYATSAEEAFLHPYFDDLGPAGWLVAAVQESPGAPLLFDVERQAGWDAVLFSRVVAHFQFFRLNDLYAANAAALLSSHRLQFERVLALSGSEGVRALASEMADSFRVGSYDPWSPVAMQAWASSDWFCAGGWAV